MKGNQVYVADDESCQLLLPRKSEVIPKRIRGFFGVGNEKMEKLVCDLYSYILWNVPLGWGGKMYGYFGGFDVLNQRAVELGIIEERPRTS
jgi:hypothetical protein